MTDGETENGDSDERGRESNTRRREWRRVWLNAVITLCHLPVRVARARDRSSRQPRRPRRRRRFVEGTTTEMATEMTTTEETETTETVTSEDVRALARDVSGDVARSVAERGERELTSEDVARYARALATCDERGHVSGTWPEVWLNCVI
ncbi:hypothetical protein GN244_ATG16161 [Phytophthora infestans]|uniref:Uncharacterized protein n=1 Tax=Phytophthora infestans TaxID=4787 RepID=A0A833W7N7_PHYIN|nr:hypothetical protein GN244_ATG16161 [Phytophthora infestans]